MVVSKMHRRSPLTNAFGRRVLLGFISCASVLWLTNSERVVDFAFGFGDDPAAFYDPSGFPLKSSRLVTLDDWDEVALPGHVKQPSGLSVRNGQIAIATDMSTVHQGLLRVAPPAGISLTAERLLLRRPLMFRQGYLEAVTFGETSDTVFAMGGGDQLYQMRTTGDRLDVITTSTLTLPEGQGVVEIVGLTYRAETGTLLAAYSPQEDQGIAIAEYTPSGELLGEVALSLPDASRAELSQLLKRANVVGLAAEGERLVILSDRHSGLIWVDLRTGEITDVWTMAGVSTMSGIALDNETLFVLQDHEYYQPIPPLRMLSVPQASQG